MLTYTEVKSLPKIAVGNLSLKAHKFSGVRRTEGDCGSQGCSGHTYRRLVCSCGYVSDVSGYESSVSEKAAIAHHKDAVVKQHLDLTFEY